MTAIFMWKVAIVGSMPGNTAEERSQPKKLCICISNASLPDNIGEGAGRAPGEGWWWEVGGGSACKPSRQDLAAEIVINLAARRWGGGGGEGGE